MSTLTKEEAYLEMAFIQADADSMTSSELYVWLQNSGLSPEIAGKLHDLVDKTKKIGEEIVAVGKIILIKIIEFAKENPHLTIGVAVGAVIAALLSTVPILGALLAPIALVLGLIGGHRLDKKANGEDIKSNLNLAVVAEDIIQIAKKFLDLLIDIFNIIFKGVVAG